MDRSGYYRNNNNNNNGANQRRRYSRSRSRERNREQNFRRRNSRSRSRERDRDNRNQMYNRYEQQNDKDLYRDIIDDDYQDYPDNRNNYNSRGGSGGGNYDNRSNRGGRDYDDRRDRDRDRDHRDRDRERDRRDYRGGNNRHANDRRRYNSAERADSEESEHPITHNQPTNKIFVTGLKQHITEADIMSTLIQADIPVSFIRLKRHRNTGASRGFAFVQFNSVEHAARWMELTQGVLILPDQSRAQMQYIMHISSWCCVKCGFSNFKSRVNCFKCDAPREDSEIGTAEGRDEISYIVTKKIMLRNLDALTNEDGVLMAMQKHAPDLAKQINKVLVSRDPLTQTSRGICYLHFESLVDSMNLRNLLTALDPPLRIDDREVVVSYCMDRENREIIPKSTSSSAASSAMMGTAGAGSTIANTAAIAQQYSLADVPRLAEYSAALYATTPEENAHYLQYYTDYYVSEIEKGNFGSLPTDTQMDEFSANSGAAVALSAIQRKQKKMDSIQTTATQAAQAAAAAKAAMLLAQQTAAIVTPKGNDGKVYPTPDVSLYQYDETSGYYYDPTTGLYYDAHSQYYYNNETGAYLYWDQRKSTYVLATPAAAAASVQDVVRQETSDDAAKAAGAVGNDETKKDKKYHEKHDKVKVAKKIVKDMEKWAKQLNQKKDYTVVATPQPILPAKNDEPQSQRAQPLGNSYADVGFSILEKKERVKLTDYMPSTATTAAAAAGNKLVSTYGGSDSDDEKPGTSAGLMKNSALGSQDASEKDYVDFQKLTCLLCKRAFQSAEILQKHLKMSNLHKENLQKFNLSRNVASDDSEPGFSGGNAGGGGAEFSYRDRAKERRLKYGESDPPPNRTRERFEKEMKSLASRGAEAAPAMPISSNNVGNRLLQKMGWSEGQGLGRSNQGRTNIIETEARSSTAGLGIKGGMQPGNNYKTYIKKMMKARYESV